MIAAAAELAVVTIRRAGLQGQARLMREVREAADQLLGSGGERLLVVYEEGAARIYCEATSPSPPGRAG